MPAGIVVELPVDLPTDVEVVPTSFVVGRGPDTRVHVAADLNGARGWHLTTFRHQGLSGFGGSEALESLWQSLSGRVYATPGEAFTAASDWLDVLDEWAAAQAEALSRVTAIIG